MDQISGIKPYMEEPEMVKKRAMRKSILLIILILVIAASLIFFAYRKVSKMAKNMQDKQNLIYLSNQQMQMSTDLARQWNEIVPNIPKIEATLPSSTDLLGFVGALEQIAQSTGVSQNVKLQNQAQGQTPVNLPGKTQTKGSSVDYTVELKGNFDQIINYLAAVEKAPYFTKVVSFNLTNSGGADKSASATIGMKIYTYQ